MVRAWYKDGDHEVDRPAPHMKDPGQFLDIKDLERIGILYFQVRPLFAFIILYTRAVLTLSGFHSGR